jgi:hypothetical protein
VIDTTTNKLYFYSSGVWRDESTVTVIATGSTTPRLLADRFAQERHVRDFGAVCDGVTDDAVALQAAINASAIGDTVRFDGTCVSTSALTMSVPITLEGGNHSKSILKFTGSNGLVMTHDGNARTQYIIRDLAVTTTASGLYTGIKFTGTTSVAFKNPYLVIEHVNVTGFSTSGVTLNEWLTAIDLTDADETVLNHVSIKGKESTWTSGYLPATTGIVITNSTNVQYTGHIIRMKTGIKITSQSEGISLNGAHIVAVETGILATGLVVPSNAFRFSDLHIAASLTAIQIDLTTTSTETLGHVFSNIFFLKRDDDGNGGSNNYKSLKLSVKRSAFTNLVFQSNFGAKDYLATGDVGISMENGSSSNTFSNITLVNPGVGLQFTGSAVDNAGQSIIVRNDTAFTMTPFSSATAGRNRLRVLYDTGTPATGDDVQYGLMDFHSAGGRVLRFVNGTNSADTWHEIYSNATETATITVTIASPAVVTWTAHGLTAGQAVKFTSTGALPTGLGAGVTYYILLNGFTTNSFSVATTPNGTAINTSGSQSGVHTGTQVASIASYRAASTLAASVDLELLPKGTLGVVRYAKPISLITANGATWERGENSELLTLSTVGATTDTAGNLLPANSIIEAVTAIVTTTITTATNWQLGDATIAGRFTAANASMTQGSSSVGTVQADQTGTSGPRQSTAAKVRVTTTGTPGAGVVRITVFYRTFVAPTN